MWCCKQKKLENINSPHYGVDFFNIVQILPLYFLIMQLKCYVSAVQKVQHTVAHNAFFRTRKKLSSWDQMGNISLILIMSVIHNVTDFFLLKFSSPEPRKVSGHFFLFCLKKTSYVQTRFTSIKNDHINYIGVPS